MDVVDFEGREQQDIRWEGQASRVGGGVGQRPPCLVRFQTTGSLTSLTHSCVGGASGRRRVRRGAKRDFLAGRSRAGETVRTRLGRVGEYVPKAVAHVDLCSVVVIEANMVGSAVDSSHGERDKAMGQRDKLIVCGRQRRYRELDGQLNTVLRLPMNGRK